MAKQIAYYIDFAWSKKYKLSENVVEQTLDAICSKLKTGEVDIGLYEGNEYYLCYYFGCEENYIHELLKIMDKFVDGVSEKIPDVTLLGIWHE